MKAYFDLLRIKDWRGYFLLSTFGFLLAAGYRQPVDKIFLFYLLVFFFLGATFSFNECFDVEEDKFNKTKKNPIVLGQLDFKAAFVFSLGLGILGLILAMFTGLKVFFFYLFLILLSFFYSAWPLRFKSRFLFDLLSHGLFFGALLFFFPFIVFQSPVMPIHYLLGLSVFQISVILELRNHLEDYRSDKKAGLETTVCFLGERRSRRLVNVLTILFPLIPFLISWSMPYLPFFLALTILFYLAFLFKKNYRILDIYVSMFYGLQAVLKVF